MMNKFKWMITGLVFMIILTFGWLNIENFLSQNTKIEANTIILEGWLKGHSLDEFYKLIVNQQIKADHIYVVGWEYLPDAVNKEPLQKALQPDRYNNHAIHLLTNSCIEINIPAEKIMGDEIELAIEGSLVDGVPAHYTVFNNKTLVHSGFCKKDTTLVSIPYKTNNQLNNAIAISFDNDIRTAEEDRNLSLLSLKMVHQDLVSEHDRWSVFFDHASMYKGYYPSNSHFVKTYLGNLGIDTATITIINTPYENFNKTSALARMFGEWIKEHRDATPGVFNIVTSSYHARRSRLAFTRQAPNDIEMGVVSVNQKKPFPDYWYKTKKLLDEFFSYLFTWLFFH